ncbi:AraC family transcriptional regulator [Paenibacillus cremeus]|nr:AraC family transcriptional regulator [Paenibacillus cremeus]
MRSGNQQPRRLTNDQFLSPSAPFHIYHQLVRERWELHWHEFYELCFVIGGSGTNILNGEPHRLAPGSMFLLTPADFHEIYPDDGGRIELFNVVFKEGCVDEAIHELLFRDLAELAVRFEAEQASGMEAEFRRIWKEAMEPRTGGAMVVRGTLERILIELVRECERQTLEFRKLGESGSTLYPTVHRALVYMHHHFRSPLTLEDAAGQAQLHPNYFSECFRKMTGHSFQQYLLDLRLTFARSLLTASDLPVTEICHASGFNTLTHFERVFKRRFGQSPRHYMRKSQR